MTAIRLGRDEFPDVALEHHLVDSMAMYLIARPRDFDVVVTDDAFAPALANVMPIESQARQLLVVPGKAPRQTGGESRAFVRGSASLGTWLGALNRLMKD